MLKNKSLTVASLMGGSIGEITNDLLPLLRKDFSEGNDILLMHCINYDQLSINEIKNFNKKVLLQHLDGNKLKPEWVAKMNLFDTIITSATTSKQAMINSGVTKPIHVIPLYLKAPSIVDTSDKEKIIFYSESSLRSKRKGVDLMYEAFCQSNMKDAHLILKISSLIRYKSTENITVINGIIPKEELQELWGKTNIYMALSRMEGFGMPIHRFLSYNKRIVVLENKYAGYNDFLKEQEGVYYVPSSRVRCIETINPEYLFASNDDAYVNAKIEDIVKVMKQAHYDELALRPFKRDVKALTLEEFYQELKTILTT